MASVIPAHDQARHDPRLRGSCVREVYFWLHERLDIVAFREQKLEVIMRGVGVEKWSASRAVNLLIQCGYLETRATLARGRAYRLVYSVPAQRSA